MGGVWRAWGGRLGWVARFPARTQWLSQISVYIEDPAGGPSVLDERWAMANGLPMAGPGPGLGPGPGIDSIEYRIDSR
jgi:hypothetical protein